MEMILLYRPHSQDRPSPSSIILCHSTEKNKWVLLSLFSSLAFVHGYIDGVFLSISMIWFSLSGGASWGKEGNGECEGMVLRFTGLSKGRNEREEMIFTTTKRKEKKNESYCKTPHSYLERREALNWRREKATSLLSLFSLPLTLRWYL